mmetsp:Transcript_7607/g.31680  ORF Transcript_7607/g.31680 Transcript_7607/m.31680 type:complete len:170 (-) Transcript_7607:351-860(-)
MFSHVGTITPESVFRDPGGALPPIVDGVLRDAVRRGCAGGISAAGVPCAAGDDGLEDLVPCRHAWTASFATRRGSSFSTNARWFVTGYSFAAASDWQSSTSDASRGARPRRAPTEPPTDGRVGGRSAALVPCADGHDVPEVLMPNAATCLFGSFSRWVPTTRINGRSPR